LSKKILRKNEFRYNTNPKVQRNDGEYHVAFVSAQKGHKKKINIITHSKKFYGEPTIPLSNNPNKSKFDKRQSRASVPVWEKDSYLKDKAKGVWVMSKKDKYKIKKFNKKH